MYNLTKDIGEQNNISKEHPEIVKGILKMADEARTKLGDLGKEGKQVRSAGMVDYPTYIGNSSNNNNTNN